MHFCEVVARVSGRLSKPRKTSLNWFIPAFVKSSVGSSPGTTGDEATMAWPFDSKNFRKVWRISAAFIPSLSAALDERFVAREGARRTGARGTVDYRRRGAPGQAPGNARPAPQMRALRARASPGFHA